MRSGGINKNGLTYGMKHGMKKGRFRGYESGPCPVCHKKPCDCQEDDHKQQSAPSMYRNGS